MSTNKRSLKAYIRYDGTGRAIPGSLILNRFKPKVGNWTEIPAYECCNPSGEIYVLRLTFTSVEDANALVGDATNVADWNLFFDLPNLGTPFQSVAIDGNTIVLTGGANIKVKPALMYDYNYNTFLEKIEDTGCITSVGGDAFSYCDGLTDVILPNCTIVYGPDDSPQNDYGGFGECINLVNISIPKLVIAGDWTFSSCYDLQAINFPELTTAGNYCFNGCPSLISVFLPKLVSTGDSCFNSCTSLISVNLPLATQIGNACFYFCTSLTTILLPSCVNLGSTVGDNLVFFSIASNTISLTVPAALLTCNAGNPDGDIQYLQANNTVNIFPAEALNIRWDSILNADALVGDSTNVADWNSYFDLPTYGTPFSSVVVNGDIVSLYGGANIETKFQLFSDNIHILEVWDNAGSIVTLGDETFGGSGENCTLEKASFPAVTKTKYLSISNYGVFGGCYYLTYVSLPKLVTMEGSEFYACDALETSGLILPFDKITSLGDYVFEFCTQITSLSFPNVISVGDYAFDGCIQLASINLPKLKYAGEAALYNCNALTTINFPELLTAGEYTFANMSNLTSVYLPKLTTVGDRCFELCTSLVGVNLPELINPGTDSTFNVCTSLVSATFPKLTNTPSSFMENCSSLTTVSMPLVTSIGPGSFDGTALGVVSFPSATFVDSSGFANCNSLTSLSLPACTNLGPTVGNDVVFNSTIGNTITLTVPSALMTCDAGSPDGDIVYLQSNNTVTIVTV